MARCSPLRYWFFIGYWIKTELDFYPGSFFLLYRCFHFKVNDLYIGNPLSTPFPAISSVLLIVACAGIKIFAAHERKYKSTFTRTFKN